MKRYVAAVAAGLTVGGVLWAADPPVASRGALGSGAQIGQNLGASGGPVQNLSRQGSLNQGLGQAVSGWTRDGVHGPELVEKIHWLQQARAGQTQPRSSLSDRNDSWQKHSERSARDLREDRREIANDQRRLRNDERRLADDRADLRHDLADYRHDRDPQAKHDSDRSRDRERDDHAKGDHDRSRDRDRDDHAKHDGDHDRSRDRDRDDHAKHDGDHDRSRDRDRDEHAKGDRDHDRSRDRDRDDHAGREDHRQGERSDHAREQNQRNDHDNFSKHVGSLASGKNDHAGHTSFVNQENRSPMPSHNPAASSHNPAASSHNSAASSHNSGRPPVPSNASASKGKGR